MSLDFAKGVSPSWPRIGTPLANDLGVLGKDGSAGVTVVSKLTSDYACPLYQPIEDLIGLSYK